MIKTKLHIFHFILKLNLRRFKTGENSYNLTNAMSNVIDFNFFSNTQKALRISGPRGWPPVCWSGWRRAWSGRCSSRRVWGRECVGGVSCGDRWNREWSRGGANGPLVAWILS